MQDGAELPGTFGLDPATLAFVTPDRRAPSSTAPARTTDARARRAVEALQPARRSRPRGLGERLHPFTPRRRALRPRRGRARRRARLPGGRAARRIRRRRRARRNRRRGGRRLDAACRRHGAEGRARRDFDARRARLGRVHRGLMVNLRPTTPSCAARARHRRGVSSEVETRPARRRRWARPNTTCRRPSSRRPAGSTRGRAKALVAACEGDLAIALAPGPESERNFNPGHDAGIGGASDEIATSLCAAGWRSRRCWPGSRRPSRIAQDREWRNDDADIWNSVIPAFNKHYPDIKVEFATSAPKEYNAALNARLAGGTAGDLIACRPFDASLELSTRSSSTGSTTSRAGQFLRRRQVRLVTDDGKTTFCVPMASVIHGFIYNKDAFKKVGAERPEDDGRVPRRARQAEEGRDLHADRHGHRRPVGGRDDGLPEHRPGLLAARRDGRP